MDAWLLPFVALHSPNALLDAVMVSPWGHPTIKPNSIDLDHWWLAKYDLDAESEKGSGQ